MESEYRAAFKYFSVYFFQTFFQHDDYDADDDDDDDDSEDDSSDDHHGDDGDSEDDVEDGEQPVRRGCATNREQLVRRRSPSFHTPNGTYIYIYIPLNCPFSFSRSILNANFFFVSLRQKMLLGSPLMGPQYSFSSACVEQIGTR